MRGSPATSVGGRTPPASPNTPTRSSPPNIQAGLGLPPPVGIVDHGQYGTGEPVGALLRPSNAGSNTAADHIDVTRAALAQLPFTTGSCPGKKLLVRIDGVGASHAHVVAAQATGFLFDWVRTHRLSVVTALSEVPDDAWSAAIDAEKKVRDCAWVIDATGTLTSPRGRRTRG